MPEETWTTDDEIHYLQHIGIYTEDPDKAPTALEMLRNYIQAAALRCNWGEIDKSKVLAFARRRLFALELRIA